MPLDNNPKAALEKVLAEGEYEAKPGVTFMWMDWGDQFVAVVRSVRGMIAVERL